MIQNTQKRVKLTQDSQVSQKQNWRNPDLLTIARTTTNMLVHIRTKYMLMLLDGSKKVEGRLCKPEFANLMPGSTITFYDGKDEGNPGSTMNVVVLSITKHATFREMLLAYGVKSFLPDHDGDIGNAEQIYLNFPGYRDGEAAYGACAMTLEALVH